MSDYSTSKLGRKGNGIPPPYFKPVLPFSSKRESERDERK